VKYDVIILGSGFGGSLTALALHRMGMRVAVVDRAGHPRFAIGESTTPIANVFLKRFGETYGLPSLVELARYGTCRSAHPDLVIGRKRGFSYFSHEPQSPFVSGTDHAADLMITANADDLDCDTHWLRQDVDAYLANLVFLEGIELFEHTDTTLTPADTGWELVLKTPDTTDAVRTDFVVDATGQRSLLASVLGLENSLSDVRTVSRALYSHFEAVDLFEADEGLKDAVGDHPFRCDDAALHHVLDEGWLWVLRFCDGRVSAGFMIADDRPMYTPEEEWTDLLRRYPSIHDQFSRAKLASVPGSIIRTARLQRLVSVAAGETWALLPFAAGFIDPLHSTGIAHTLWAVDRLTAALGGSAELRRDALARYSTNVLDEVRFIDLLVSTNYAVRGDFRLWTAATLLYAAAATLSEHRLSEQHTPSEAGGYLCALDDSFRRAVTHAANELVAASSSADEKRLLDSLELAEERLHPFNRVGLFRPRIHNMYEYTASPV
jgi:FADH2 O2-dependent halogenase